MILGYADQSLILLIVTSCAAKQQVVHWHPEYMTEEIAKRRSKPKRKRPLAAQSLLYARSISKPTCSNCATGVTKQHGVYSVLIPNSTYARSGNGHGVSRLMYLCVSA